LGRASNPPFLEVKWVFARSVGVAVSQTSLVMIEYKAKWEGIPVVYINPAYTSLYCHYCGSKGVREGLTFKCLNCGRTYNADANASMNLAKKFRQLLDDASKRMTEECSQADLSFAWEGETRLPLQTNTQPRNGKQMNGMMVIRTVSLPLGGWR